jgi:hypothetical protein
MLQQVDNLFPYHDKFIQLISIFHAGGLNCVNCELFKFCCLTVFVSIKLTVLKYNTVVFKMSGAKRKRHVMAMEQKLKAI